MYALAMKLRSKSKSKGYVEFKDKILEIKHSMCWNQSGDAEAVWYTENIPVCPQCLTKRSLFPYFPKALSTHTLQTLPMEKCSTKCFIHSHMLYLFIFQQKVAYWMCVPGNSWNPFIRLSPSFSYTSPSQEPTPAGPSPLSAVKYLGVQQTVKQSAVGPSLHHCK